MSTQEWHCLIAETPRAGRWNGCLLVSSGTTQATTIDYIAKARKSPSGPDYLMVFSEVEQPTTGRRGQEMLILAGFDVRGLSPDDRTRLEKKLSTLLNSLEGLVVKEIDWDQHRQPSMLERPELSKWLGELKNDFRLTPLSPIKRARLGGSKRPHLPLWFRAIMAIICLAIAYYVFPGLWQKLKSKLEDIPIKSPEAHSIKIDKKTAHALSAWRHDLGLDELKEETEDKLILRIRQVLEEQLLIERVRSKSQSPEKSLKIIVGLLANFPRDNDPAGGRVEVNRDSPRRDDSFAYLHDQGLRRNVIKVFSLRKGSNETPYVRFAIDNDATIAERSKCLFSPDVTCFREMMGKAEEAVNLLLDLSQKKDNSETWTQIRKDLPGDQLSKLNKLCSDAHNSHWSFYIPSDYAAMSQLGGFIKKVMNAHDPEWHKGDKNDIKSIFRSLIHHRSDLDRHKRAESRNEFKAAYKSLIDLADEIKKYNERANQEQPDPSS